MHFPLDGGNRVLSPSSHSQDVQIEDFEIFKFLSPIAMIFKKAKFLSQEPTIENFRAFSIFYGVRTRFFESRVVPGPDLN